MISLLPGWAERLANVAPQPAARVQLPLSRSYFAGRTTFVQDVDGAEQMVQLAGEVPITCIGIDTEFRYKRSDAVALRGERQWRDIRTCQPFCIALVVLSDDEVVKFVVDLRIPALLPYVARVLQLPVTFAAHYVQAELFVLWTLGLREPSQIWDTYIAERALRLGTNNRLGGAPALDAEELAQVRQRAAQSAKSLSLASVAAAYAIETPSALEKESRQASFLTKPQDAPLSEAEIDYCANDAALAAVIRGRQRIACDRHGITEALDGAVMPWAVTAAEIEWNGVQYDRAACERLLQASATGRAAIATQLNNYGIANPDSHPQVANFIVAAGLAAHFPHRKHGSIIATDDVLKDREHLHPAITLIRRFRKIRQLASDPAVQGQITGADGRVHPRINVLGSDTGRTQSSTPNIMGIGRVFRPLIIPRSRHGIGDVDLSQIEAGVAGAVLGDERLISDFNAGDVYVAMAKRVFADQLDQAARQLADADFKRCHKGLRDQTKPLWLGIIYGMAIATVAARIGKSVEEAKRLWKAFQEAYPMLFERMEEARRQSVRRGYAYCLGLRRFVPSSRGNSAKLHRALGNAYVQGAAAVMFCAAGNRLRRLYPQYGARLLVPVHDAFVFEAPLDRLDEVAEITKRIMVEAVQERFPELRPRAEANIAQPHCWNYEGHADSVERFLEDPTYSL
jgi:DNA polymerase I